MYDWPEVRGATDRLWAQVRDRVRAAGIAAPAALTRDDGPWAHWRSPALCLSQTCGFPYRTELHERVTLVGTPDFGLPGAAPGYYYSQLVVRRQAEGAFTDFMTKVLALNGFDSQSGWAAPMNHALRFGGTFTRFEETGAHVESARAVAEGRADIAAIDAVTWRLITAYRPDMARELRVLGHTEPTPGLPLITSPDLQAEPLANAYSQAVDAIDQSDRLTLGLKGLVAIPAQAYLSVPTPALPNKRQT